ncbi:methionyl-tRNA formyltransferase [Metapseudomonas resinovorans]|uniref:methionyl-tRNA formyltransferase n=1 Tax=Metapseudomonas resinovorans TaxID=53412 RepID=UPI00040B2C9D|nr:methionyl-tRNA formyltransferase [Pseudomonas resinovorans]MDE3739531.1 methionyl-tRNA formyltransferase [Pseudomonas resinovorans]
MRIVFFGFQRWGTETLEALLDSGHDIPLVVTHPPSRNPADNLWAASVADLAERWRIPLVECRYANAPELCARIAALQPDLLVLSNWRTWLSPKVCDLARHGGINLHDALLPRYGGFAPINWAVANGETQTGVTVHRVEDELDLGAILLQEIVPIHPRDTATDIFQRTLPLFASLAIAAVDALAKGSARFTAQDASQATFFHKRGEREMRINWSLPVRDIHNLIRAQSPPYPAAFSTFAGERLELLGASPAPRDYRGTPGRVLCTADGVVVLCGPPGPQGLLIETVATEQHPAMPAKQFFAGCSGYFD